MMSELTILLQVSDILGVVLGPQYSKATMWNSRWGRRNEQAAAFQFSDTQGRFSAFLMRLEGLPGNAQGYTRLVYHLDVKVSDGATFELSQNELDRVRIKTPRLFLSPHLPSPQTHEANPPA